jgi:ArsR family transcriptional regulator, virulence genes transcriptional regulator
MAVATTKDAIILKGAGNSAIKLDYNVLRRSVLILRAVNHDLRQKMIKLLEDEGRMTVTEIYVKLRLEQSVASQHLALLRRAGIVVTQREGKFIFYSLDKERIAEIARLLDELVK